MSVLLFMVALLPWSEKPQYLDLKALGPKQFAVVTTATRLEVVLYEECEIGTPLKTVAVAVDGPLTRTSNTPEGLATSPAYVLIGADQKRLFFQLQPAGIGVYDLESRTMSTLYLRHYDSVGKVWPVADRLLVATEMVTRSTSKIPCERSYFTWLDAGGAVQGCYGEAKPFLEAFSEGDIPTVAYRPQTQESIVYYRKSGDMFTFGASGEASQRQIDHHLVKQQAKQITPEQLFALATDLVLVKRTPQAVSVFRLDEGAWTLQGQFKGAFSACIALSGAVVMLEKGKLVKRDVPTIH